MRRLFGAFASSLLLVCPACRYGRMFRSHFKLNVRCPTCGVIFERDSGEITGGMAINATLTSTLVVFGSSLAFFTDVPAFPLILGLGAFTCIFPLIFYRYARALWISIIFLTGSMFED